MTRHSLRLPMALIICSYLAAVASGLLLNRLYPPKITEDIKMLPNSHIMKLMSLGNSGFVADMLFAEVNIHSGSLMWKPLRIKFNSAWAFKAMDVITDLDPKYLTAYLFTGMGCIHAFSDAKLARPILEKGMVNLPDNWEIPYWIGYDYFNYLRDDKTAAHFFMIAAKRPGAPQNFLAMLLTTSRHGGEYGKAIWAMERMLKSTKNKALQIIYAKKLADLKNLYIMQRAAKKYKAVNNRFPAKLSDLVGAGFLKKIPEAPGELVYFWDKSKEMVTQKINPPRQ
ncbi:MAG: hypothetical protein GXP59_02370 [Deltaproteobacteria bacterium]|nr:hypothetical protein [Deltaproteobacteria bacterium]